MRRHLLELPSIFYRYVDDCFAVFDSLDSIKIFRDSLNEVHPNIKFTTEIQNNKCINFLDVLVDNSSTTVTTSYISQTDQHWIIFQMEQLCTTPL